MPNPLTDDQREAAKLLAEGVSQAAVAERLDTSSTSVRRWEGRDDFRALIEKHRPSAPVRTGADDSAPTRSPEQVLREASQQLMKNGIPSVAAASAAKELAKLEAAKANESAARANATVEQVLLTGHDDLDAQVQAILAEYPDTETVYIVLAARDAGPNARGAQIVGLTDGPWEPSQTDSRAFRGVTP